MFVKYCELISEETGVTPEKQVDTRKNKKGSTGWGRLMRKTICQWYASKSPEQLAMHLTKYKSREGYSHRDLFRLAHPTPNENRFSGDHSLEVEQLYRFAVKGPYLTFELGF